jgi:hypothetical protein
LIKSLDNPAIGTESLEQKAPAWLEEMEALGYRPYIATSERLLPIFNTKPFGKDAACFVMENPEHHAFHEAYLLSNSLSFEKPDIKMPHWVLVDCVLLQTAIVGFMKKVSEIPETLLKHYQEDASVDVDQLTYLPVSGQIASMAADGKSVVGLSLFSLGPKLGEPKGLGLYTKALALEVYRAAQYEYVYGITQYDNRSLRIHGRFADKMEIYQATVPLHPFKDMTLIYRMSLKYDPYKLDEKPPENEPTFWLNAKDAEGKKRIQAGMKAGKRFLIAPPFIVKRDGEVFLPIVEEDASK